MKEPQFKSARTHAQTMMMDLMVMSPATPILTDYTIHFPVWTALQCDLPKSTFLSSVPPDTLAKFCIVCLPLSNSSPTTGDVPLLLLRHQKERIFKQVIDDDATSGACFLHPSSFTLTGS